MFIGNSVKDDDLALTAQETVNWYIESQKEGARNSKALIGAQGTSEWTRSEERRVGKECRSRWSPYH